MLTIKMLAHYLQGIENFKYGRAKIKPTIMWHLKIRIMKNFIISSISTFILISSCAEKEEVNIQELIIGDWDVVEYATYQEGEEAILVEGKPYWHLERYSQGISIANDGYYYRYGLINEVNKTSYNEKGGWKITEKLDHITFSIPNFQSQEPYQIQAEIIDLNNKNLWIKYREGGYIAEYLYQKKIEASRNKSEPQTSMDTQFSKFIFLSSFSSRVE